MPLQLILGGEIVKYKGEPNEMLTMSLNSFQLKFSSEGIFDTTAFLKSFENIVLIPRLDLHRQRIEEVQEGIQIPEATQVDPPKEEKEYTCKTCGEKVEGMGKYLAHCRTHSKKEGA